MGKNDYFNYVIIAIGIYCIIKGIITITTGNISKREEATLNGYSDKGIKRYKILSAVTNIIGGLICGMLGVVKIINLFDTNIFNIVVLAVLGVMLVVYVLIRKSCKEAK